MVTSLYTADIKLNKFDKNYKRYLVAINETGVLLVEHNLFVLSFDNAEEFKKEVDIKDNNLNHIGEINI